ncbi:unnamed protein product [Arabidopsis halleri]
MARLSSGEILRPFSSSFSSLKRCKTSVLWDIENVLIPKSVDPCFLSGNIMRSLQKCNFFGPVTIIAVGNFKNFKERDDEILHLTGVEMDYENPLKIQRKTISEKSDKRILVRMTEWIFRNHVPSNILLVTGDGGFADALNELGTFGYNMLLAHPGWRSFSHKLEFVSTTIWAWSTLAAGGLPTIYHQTLHHKMRARDRYANEPVIRVLEAINQLEAKGIMAIVANISTLIQQNHNTSSGMVLLDQSQDISDSRHNTFCFQLGNGFQDSADGSISISISISSTPPLKFWKFPTAMIVTGPKKLHFCRER